MQEKEECKSYTHYLSNPLAYRFTVGIGLHEISGVISRGQLVYAALSPTGPVDLSLGINGALSRVSSTASTVQLYEIHLVAPGLLPKLCY